MIAHQHGDRVCVRGDRHLDRTPLPVVESICEQVAHNSLDAPRVDFGFHLLIWLV
jgi:hypothetical protein